MWLLFRGPFTLQLATHILAVPIQRRQPRLTCLQRDLAPLADQSGGIAVEEPNRCRHVVVGDVRPGAGQRSSTLSGGSARGMREGRGGCSGADSGDFGRELS